MPLRHALPLLACLACLGLLAGPAMCGENPQEGGALHYAHGETLLKKGQIDEAAKAFRAAARAEPDNAAYMERALILRRVQSLRRFVAGNEPSGQASGQPSGQPSGQASGQWERSAGSLHGFYLQNGLLRFALELDQTAHERLKNATSAARLAETQLELGKNVETANLLAESSATSPVHAAYHGIALARLGRSDDARALALLAVVKEDSPPAFLLDVARLRALLGEHDGALALMRTSFEQTPAPALPAAKKRVRAQADFQPLAMLPEFAQVLRTESQVKATCSGGSSCGSCPHRSGCAGAKR